MGLLEGKTALITGAARGIGKAIALRFAEEGANIAFTDLVIDELGQATEQEIAAKGVNAKGYASNAADFGQTEDVVKQIKEEFGSIDILVNNAGITKDVGRRDSRQPEVCIQFHPRLCAYHDASAWWFNHQYVVCRWCSWQCRSGKLCSFQGWSYCFGKEYCSGDGTEGNPCQCHRTGIHRHCYDSSSV